jgi:hypothetical protein
MTDLAPYYSAFRSAAIFGSGVAATFGLTSAGQSSDMLSGVDHLIAGGKEIVTGVGILAPIVLGIWGVLTHRPTAVLTAAAEIPGPEKLAAFHGIPDDAKLKVVEALPDVAKVVVKKTASDGVAAAASDPTRPKVVVESLFVK